VAWCLSASVHWLSLDSDQSIIIGTSLHSPSLGSSFQLQNCGEKRDGGRRDGRTGEATAAAAAAAALKTTPILLGSNQPWYPMLLFATNSFAMLCQPWKKRKRKEHHPKTKNVAFAMLCSDVCEESEGEVGIVCSINLIKQ
jgi:hypothetical protein